MRTIFSFLEEILVEVYNIHGAARIRGPWGPQDPNAEKWMKFIFYELSTFKSARERNLRNSFEVVMELFAQYIIQGEVSFKKLPRCFGSNQAYGKGFRYCARNEEILDDYQSVVDGLARDLNYYFDELLGEATNHILVM